MVELTWFQHGPCESSARWLKIKLDIWRYYYYAGQLESNAVRVVCLGFSTVFVRGKCASFLHFARHVTSSAGQYKRADDQQLQPYEDERRNLTHPSLVAIEYCIRWLLLPQVAGRQAASSDGIPTHEVQAGGYAYVMQTHAAINTVVRQTAHHHQTIQYRTSASGIWSLRC